MGKLRVDLVNVLAMIDVYNQILAEVIHFKHIFFLNGLNVNNLPNLYDPYELHIYFSQHKSEILFIIRKNDIFLFFNLKLDPGLVTPGGSLKYTSTVPLNGVV